MRDAVTLGLTISLLNSEAALARGSRTRRRAWNARRNAGSLGNRSSDLLSQGEDMEGDHVKTRAMFTFFSKMLTFIAP
jgi:hypothetical protein